MQRNKWPLLAKIWISNFMVPDFRFWFFTFDLHAAVESGNRNFFHFRFQHCNVAPMQHPRTCRGISGLSLLKSKFSISWFPIFYFGFPLLIPMRQRSKCNKKRKSEFLLIFYFRVALLLPCSIKAHASKQVVSPCRNQNFWFRGFSIFDFYVTLLIPIRQQSTCSGMQRSKFLSISNFNVALLFLCDIRAHVVK